MSKRWIRDLMAGIGVKWIEEEWHEGSIREVKGGPNA
jgi:hypothetical protein